MPLSKETPEAVIARLRASRLTEEKDRQQAVLLCYGEIRPVCEELLNNYGRLH